LPDYSRPGEEPGSVLLTSLPSPHGDHFHLGEAVVAARDATGLRNPAVWTALERKGLVRRGAAGGAVLTAAALAYDTGLRQTILAKPAD
jgi:LmbE family N-acetylglucosaminyl deacetylase